MAAELVNAATSDKLAEVDWTKNIEIGELVARDQGVSKDVIKAIKKRLGSKHSDAQLYAVMLLEMLMNNIGEHIHKQVIKFGILPILVKIVKKKTDLPVREKIFLLLDATQTALGGTSGKFPQYYSAFYDLVSSGVQFPQRSWSILSDYPPAQEVAHKGPDHLSSRTIEKNPFVKEPVSSRQDRYFQGTGSPSVSELSIIQKANNALEVLKDVLDAVDVQRPEMAKDEFTLDLVEQCSFQKQRIMHLVMTSRDEHVVSQAIELNEELQNVLTRHDAILMGRCLSATNHVNYDDIEEEEEDDQLFLRLQKGKARARPEDEERIVRMPAADLFGSVPERLYRPLIRPLPTEKTQEAQGQCLPVSIPPPPAKHIEREKFFQETKSDGSDVNSRMRGLFLHSRNASSSHSGSICLSE